MDLINLYVQEVTRRLPKKTREDISLELHSTILDMLPSDYTKHDVKQVLDQLGNPAVLASRYSNRPMHLIGPKFYDIYVSILKLVFIIALSVVSILFIIEKASTIITDAAPLLIVVVSLGELIWTLLSTIIQAFFWVSIVFIILERTIKSEDSGPLSLSGEKWTPDDLENIPNIPLKKKISQGEVIFSLIWAVLFPILYFNADKIIGIYDNLEFAIPLFNQETLVAYVVIVIILIILEIARVAYFAIVRQWTFKLALSNTVIHLIGFIFLIVIASEPNLFHQDFALYMGDILEKPLETVQSTMLWIKWLIVSIAIVTGIIDIINGFRKASIK